MPVISSTSCHCQVAASLAPKVRRSTCEAMGMAIMLVGFGTRRRKLSMM